MVSPFEEKPAVVIQGTDSPVELPHIRRAIAEPHGGQNIGGHIRFASLEALQAQLKIMKGLLD